MCQYPKTIYYIVKLIFNRFIILNNNNSSKHNFSHSIEISNNLNYRKINLKFKINKRYKTKMKMILFLIKNIDGKIKLVKIIHVVIKFYIIYYLYYYKINKFISFFKLNIFKI